MAGADDLIGYLDGLADELRGKGEKALSGFDGDDVHDARVASRRLSAAAGLLAPLVGRKARRSVERAWDKARRRLGKHRDVDVMLARLAELGRDERLASGANLVAEVLEARRESLRAKARSALPEAKHWCAWRDDVAAHAEGVSAVVSEAVHDGLDEVVRLAGTMASPHPLRIAAKELRYALELAAEAGVWEGEAVLEKFKALQDTLGAWHDFAMLADEALRLARKGDGPFRSERDALQLAELAAECLHKAQWKLGEFRSDWGREGGQIERSVRAAFPLVRDVPPPPPDPVTDAGEAIVIPPADVGEAGEAGDDDDESPVED